MSTMLLLFACATEWSDVRLDAPHVVQRPDFCGEACVEMALRRLGHDVDQDDVFVASGLDPLLGRGMVTRELRETLVAIGFDVGPTWYRGDVREQWAALHADLVAGVPSIVCMYATEGGPEHFRLVTGYSTWTDTVIVQDPAELDGPTELRLDRFLSLWPLQTDTGEVIVRLRLASEGPCFSPLARGNPSAEPGYPRLAPDCVGGSSSATGIRPRLSGDSRGPLSLPSPSTGVDAAQLAQAVRRVKAVAPVNATIRVVPPFVLVGDEPEATVDARAALLDRTLELFRADYFDVELEEPWEIWLFRDADSYNRNTYALFSQYPSTPYGFADGNHRALVMNIATGGGTLVHELAHPYLNTGIPWVPTWFNEGFASLFEHVGEEDGHLVGYVNWRLPTLQLHIEAGDVPDLATYMAQDTDTFRGERVALNYAMARYLCFYLQEQGKLGEYYRALKASPEDPTGLATLQRVLGEADMGDFQQRWQVWAMALE